MDLELRHLKLVLAIAETGNMTRAGSRLHLTQSALSHQLRDAEESLGALLFTRMPRRMVLTAAGERLLRAARMVLTELGEAAQEIGRGVLGGRHVLRIATQCYTVYHWLPSRVRQYEKQFPGAEVQVVAEATPHPYASLLEGKLDLAIINTPVRDRLIRYAPLFLDEFVAIVAPQHRVASQRFVELRDFADETLFIYPPREESCFLTQILAPAGVTPRNVQQIQLTEAMIELVKGGMGVAVLARWAVAPHVASGSIRALPITKSGWRRQWQAAVLRNQPSDPHREAFVRLLQDHPIPGPLNARALGCRMRTASTRRQEPVPEHFAVGWKPARVLKRGRASKEGRGSQE